MRLRRFEKVYAVKERLLGARIKGINITKLNNESIL